MRTQVLGVGKGDEGRGEGEEGSKHRGTLGDLMKLSGLCPGDSRVQSIVSFQEAGICASRPSSDIVPE